MRKTTLTVAALLIASSAWAGGTSLKTNVSPLTQACNLGNCDYDASVVCATNTDCNFGSVSAKSKISMTGLGRIKAQLKDVVDAAGMPGAGNYLLNLVIFGDAGVEVVSLEVVVADGKGKVDVTLDASLFPPAGDTAFLAFSELTVPAAVPANCPSGNDLANINLRLLDADCFTNAIGIIGVLSGT